MKKRWKLKIENKNENFVIVLKLQNVTNLMNEVHGNTFLLFPTMSTSHFDGMGSYPTAATMPLRGQVVN